MTPKELLYIEDALGHQKNMTDYCNNFASTLSDGELKNFVQELSQKSKTNFDKIYSLLK